MTIRSLAQGLNENIEVDQHIFFFLPVLSSSVEFDELSAVVDIPDEGAVPAKNKCEWCTQLRLSAHIPSRFIWKCIAIAVAEKRLEISKRPGVNKI